MPKTDILKASVGVSANFIYTGLRKVLFLMGIAGALGVMLMLGLVAVIAAIVK